jgi:2-iminobutanoate/2-iminopropanoate deaminase
MSTPTVSYPILPDTPVSHLPFSPVVVAGGLIFVSGQASVDATGNIVSGTFEEEFHRSMDNVKRVLAAANSDLAHVIQTRNYVQRGTDVALFNQLYRTYFSAPFPARTTIVNCLGEALLFEIEVVAVPRSDP